MYEAFSLIRVEDFAGEGRRRKSWSARLDRKVPEVIEPGNAW